MDPAVIDDADLSLPRKSVLPGTGFFIPDNLDVPPTEEVTGPDLASAERVAIADPDADGLSTVAILRAAFGPVTLVPAGPHEFEAALEATADTIADGAHLFIADLNPDNADSVVPLLDDLASRDVRVDWFDHHQWDEDIATAVRSSGVELVIGDSDEECTADVAIRSIEREIPFHLKELAAVTRDHDLWIRNDERSDDLADFAHWSDPEEYLDIVAETGPDLPQDVAAFLEERRVEKRALIELAIDRALTSEIGPWSVAVTYGRCSQNEVAEGLRQEGHDLVIVIKPAGSVSLRGSEGFERCHEVAEQLGGGGHPRAAGCKPDIYDDMLDFAHHWSTQGAVTRRRLLTAVEALDWTDQD